MGAEVGELRYGMVITEEIFCKFVNEDTEYELDKSIQSRHPKAELYNPYETESYLIIHKDTDTGSWGNNEGLSAYNGANYLGKTIQSQPEKWEKDIEMLCKELNIPFDSNKCGWFLIGRYD